MGKGRNAEALTEAHLADAWEERRYDAAALVDSRGRRLQVIFPGRRWGGPGPDFQGALIALGDGSMLRGDVEVHTSASSWTRHGHATNPAYRKVVLHVVQEADAVALDAGGQPLPTLVLVVRPARVARFPRPCLPDAGEVREVVEAAGRERFGQKAARFEGDLAAVDADQVLWRGVAEALGYSQNTRPFGLLADAVPWTEAEQAFADGGRVAVSALLLGTGGLLDEATAAERVAWERLERMGARGWRTGGWVRSALRPANDPSQRCRALAALAAEWAGGAASKGGPAERVLATVADAARAPRPERALDQLLMVPQLLGAGRARTIAANVLLPFAAAAGLEEAAGLYERLAGEPANRVVQYMAEQLGGSPRSFPSACQRQGLLHLFKMRCASRLCHLCPAARRQGAVA